ncbi:hypothetical protein VISI1226_16638 [Vibrio sinaloensis DSM 21326]|uniref:Transglutaminase-like domain-containing protein n=1 Tax=Vibrio sinaloensis DSM 21326 TaxID=945550 RepID=E8M534_PHOS4|nr:transglutaminase-like domain-containing protein [Vibrio sinaloensis]EGA70885.1 hypothetical protein VISI1226_16638 [Vibrio sinaloensis DSM 21326]
MTNRQKRYNEMFNAGLDFLRETVLAKMTTFIVLFTFNFVFYFSPTALAVKADFNQQDQQEAAITALLESTPEAKLSHRLSKLKEAIVYEVAEEVKADKAPQGFLARTWSSLTSSGPISTDSILELERLASEVEMAYVEAIEKLKTEIADSTQQTSKLSSTALALLEERQNQALKQVESQYAHLTTLLQNLTEADSEDVQIQAYEDLTDFLVNSQFKATHTPATPENLPWRTPSADVREPIEDVKELTSLLSDTEAQLVDEPMQMAARSLSGSEPVRPELAESIEVVLTPEIRALAAELNHSSIEIYTWVHNNIKFIPSYGSIQGAQQTLELKQGNAMDTASLLIALLRASEIPARYAYGTVIIPAEKVMNWVGGAENPEAAQTILGMGGIPTTAIVQGGEIVSFKLEHVWTEAWVDFMPSRGVVERSGDSWIPMDASFKQYVFTQGMNITEQVPFDVEALESSIRQSTTFDNQQGWVGNLPAEELNILLSQYETQLTEYIVKQNPSAAVSDVLGLQQVKVIPPAPLSAGLPYNQVLLNNTFNEVPNQLQHKFRYSLANNSYGEAVILIELPTASLAGKLLALSFNTATAEDEEIVLSYLPKADKDGVIDPATVTRTVPGYLVNMVAKFNVGDAIIQSGIVGTMGSELQETIGLWSPSTGWQSSVNQPSIGMYRAIALNLQGVSATQGKELEESVKLTKSKLESGDPSEIANLTKHDLVGDQLQTTILNYFALNNMQDKIAAQHAGMIQYNLPSFGIFTTNLQTQYWFGLPRHVTFSGHAMDVDHVAQLSVAKNNDTQAGIAFSLGVGSRWSAMEHVVPEMVLSTDTISAKGISAAKALAIASEQGQRIWTITKDNMELALSSIRLDLAVEMDIRNAVLSGKTVTAHEEQINFNGWLGEGYIIIDPKTGAGAYMISGGGNGSFVDSAGENANLIALLLGVASVLAAFAAAPTVAIPVAPLILLSLLAVTILATTLIIMATDLDLIEAGCPDTMRMLSASLMVLAFVFGLFAPLGFAIILAIMGWVYTNIAPTLGARLCSILGRNR